MDGIATSATTGSARPRVQDPVIVSRRRTAQRNRRVGGKASRDHVFVRARARGHHQPHRRTRRTRGPRRVQSRPLSQGSTDKVRNPINPHAPGARQSKTSEASRSCGPHEVAGPQATVGGGEGERQVRSTGSDRWHKNPFAIQCFEPQIVRKRQRRLSGVDDLEAYSRAIL